MEYKKIRSGLKDLIQRSKDAEKGYNEIAVDSSSPAIRRIATNLKNMRKRLTSELEKELTAYGGDPSDVSSSYLGKLHRAWIDLKLSATSKEVEPAVDEIERGEERAIEDYEEVLKEVDMFDSTRVMLNKHVTYIKETLSEMKEMKKDFQTVDA